MRAEREDWLGAATDAFRAGGVDAVSVEGIARTLGVTKGSFYWYFRDRADLLEALLVAWEEETNVLIEESEREEEPLRRVLRFFALVAGRRGQLPDSEFFAWARRDAKVAKRGAAVEERRIRFIRDCLAASGLKRTEADRRAEAGYLATLGWIDRSTRRKDSADDFRAFTEHLFRTLFEGILSVRRTRTESARFARMY